jgi:hypothetical protein
MMTWKVIERKLPWPNLMYYLGIHLDGLRKTTEDLSQNSRSPDDTKILIIIDTSPNVFYKQPHAHGHLFI